MNKMKKYLLSIAFVGILIAASGIGTYAWFTSESKAEGTLVNGTLSLGEMESLFDHQGFTPSQLLYSEWQTIDNTGDLDQALRATYTHNVDKENIDISQYKVGYTALKYKEKPDEDELEQQKYELEKLFDGTTNPINPFSEHAGDVEVSSGLLTNEEMSTLNDAKTGETIILGDNDEFWALDADEYIDIVFG